MHGLLASQAHVPPKGVLAAAAAPCGRVHMAVGKSGLEGTAQATMAALKNMRSKLDGRTPNLVLVYFCGTPYFRDR